MVLDTCGRVGLNAWAQCSWCPFYQTRAASAASASGFLILQVACLRQVDYVPRFVGDAPGFPGQSKSQTTANARSTLHIIHAMAHGPSGVGHKRDNERLHHLVATAGREASPIQLQKAAPPSPGAGKTPWLFLSAPYQRVPNFHHRI